MQPEQLRAARHVANLTQQQVAERLGISQAYLALLERGGRPITPRLASRIANLYDLDPIALPLETDDMSSWNSELLAVAVAGLGYPGFRNLRRNHRRNPAVVLAGAIATEDVEVRVIEALPWLVAQYSDLDWQWLIREAKLRDVQNRLGFLVTLGWQVAENRGDRAAAGRLRRIEQVVDRSRLVREDTLCQGSLSDAERRWLRQRRPTAARHWNLLTDLRFESLPYAA